MRKWILLLLIGMMVLPLAIALPMCKDSVNINSNCTMVTPEITCGTYDYSIYNLNGSQVESGTLTSLNASIYYFNFTLAKGNYIIKLCDGTTREVYVEPSEDYNMIIGAIILSPMLLAFLLLFIAHSLGSDHTPVKIFLMLLSLIFIFVTWNFGTVALVEFYGMPELQDAIGGTTYWYGWVFYIMVFYFSLYLVITLVKGINKKKQEKLEY